MPGREAVNLAAIDWTLPSFDSEAPFSAAPVSSDQRQIQLALQAAKELNRMRVLRMVGRLLLFACVPLFALVVLMGAGGRAKSPWLWLEAGSMVVACFGCLTTTVALDVRRWVTCLGMTGLAVGSLFHFGPLLGSGLIFVATQLIGSLLVGRGGALLIISILIGSMVAASTLGTLTELTLFHFSGLEFSLRDWVRLTATSSVALVGIWIIFERMQLEQWKTFEKEVALRVRERRLVAEREKVVRRAASFQRLESLGRLAGGIAHDFNNALVVVQCGIETLLDGDVSTEERMEVARELEDAVERAGGTARQLLSFAKRNVEEIGQCSPVDVLSQLRKESIRLVPAHVQLSMKLQPTPMVAIAAPALEQLVLNLVQNARDSLGEQSGTIEVAVTTDRDTGGMRLSVTDDGSGMDPHVADYAFEPFFTTKGDQGAGLGLATVWGIIRRHGGEVSLDTEPGRGTTVHLYLPALSERGHSSIDSIPSVPAASPQAGAARILILEDEPPVRAALRRIFVHLGFEVTEAGTVEEARQACRKNAFHLLLSDGVVPDGGVGTFIQDFSQQFRRAPVILCSGYLEEDLALQGVARGKCTFLAKPFTVADLTSVVKELLPSHFSEQTQG